MATISIPTHKLRESILLGNSPEFFAQTFESLGGQQIGAELFHPAEEGAPPLSFSTLLSGTTEGALHDAISRADLIHLSLDFGVDCLIDNATVLLERLLPNTFPRDTRHVLLDFTLPGVEISVPQLQQVLDLAAILQTHTPLTLAITPQTHTAPEQKIHHLRQQLSLTEVLLVDFPKLSSATVRGFHTFPSATESTGQECSENTFAALLASYAAAQILNLPETSSLEIAYITAQYYLSENSLPSWIEIQAQFCHNAAK